jgi:tetratricopeptide (TPR) repeat protein
MMNYRVFIASFVVFILALSSLGGQELTEQEVLRIENEAYNAYQEGTQLEAQGDISGALPKYEEAVAKYEQTTSAKPENIIITAEMYNKISLLYYQTGNVRKAGEFAEKSLEKYQLLVTEDNPYTQIIDALYKNLSVFWYTAREYDKALQYYEIRRERDPDNYQIVLSMSNIYKQIGQPQEALNVLLQYDEQYEHYRVKKAIAELYEEAFNDTGKAIQFYEQTFALNPQDVDILQKIGLLYHELGEVENAIKAYEDFIATEPDANTLRKVYKNLGIFYQNIGDNANAIEAFENSISIEFDKEIALALIQMYYSQGNYTKAREYIRAVRNIEPGNPQAHYYLGLIYLEEENLKAALQEFQAITDHPTLGSAAREQIEYIQQRL